TLLTWCCPSCGVTAPRAESSCLQWIQVNVELAPRSSSLHADEQPLFGEIEPLVASERTRGLTCFWFLHKDPAIRLRFGGERLPPGLLQRLADVLDGLVRAGVVQRWFPSVYEAETFF